MMDNMQINDIAYQTRVASKQRLAAILNCKKTFFNDRNYDPHHCPYMNPLVASSWIKYRNMGVNPDINFNDCKLSASDFSKVIDENRIILDIAKPIFESFKELVSNSHLVLVDKNGVILLREGTISKNLLIERVGAEGLLLSEKNVGTTAHSLSMQHRRPINILGAEFYCHFFEDVISATGAPIIAENGEVTASIILVRRSIGGDGEAEFTPSLVYTSMGMIAAMATSIENALRLRKSYERLETANSYLSVAYNTIKTTLSFIDEGIITVDETGKILHINSEGARILKLKHEERGSRNITDFLNRNSNLMNMVKSGHKNDIEETIYSGNDEADYLVNIRPILAQGVSVGGVIRLNNAEKINAIVVDRIGATARYSFEDLIGESKELKKAIDMGRYFADSSENILLIGESGTGKELFAQAIHNQHRPQGPFIALNCAAMPRSLIESELFGYEGGSFTGAERKGRPGKIELASGGTLFLDEISDMPLELQAVLLRVLQDKRVMRIGSHNYKKVDFRVIAACNKDLTKLVKEKLFREDLYYRLAVLSIILPPLRRRGNDVEILSQYFVSHYSNKMGWKAPQISPDTMEKICKYDWPGNVRQLENALIYAANLVRGGTIEPKHLPVIVLSGKHDSSVEGKNTVEIHDNKVQPLKAMEKGMIANALASTNNNLTLAARLLGISKNTIYRKIKEYNLGMFDSSN